MNPIPVYGEFDLSNFQVVKSKECGYTIDKKKKRRCVQCQQQHR